MYLMYMFKEYLTLDKLQELICHKTQPTNNIHLMYIYNLILALNNLYYAIKPNKTQTCRDFGLFLKSFEPLLQLLAFEQESPNKNSQLNFCLLPMIIRRCPWCNGYRRRKWTRWHEFKSWTEGLVNMVTNNNNNNTHSHMLDSSTSESAPHQQKMT